MSTLGAESGSSREQIRSPWQHLCDKVLKDAVSGERLRGYVVERLVADVTMMIPTLSFDSSTVHNPWNSLAYNQANKPAAQSLNWWAVDYVLLRWSYLPKELETKILAIAEEYETIQQRAGSSPA